MYFAQFPIIYYDYDINGVRQLRLVKDVTLNVRIRKAILENIAVYDEYDIREGETPEIIAAKVYGSPLYHWVIMLCNNVYDYIEDWPLSYQQFLSYLADKYVTTEETYATHHYEDPDTGLIVNSDFAGAVPISNYTYEERLNEGKRRIKLISPNVLSQVLNEFKGMF